jgi:hypothetical protein
MVIMVKRIHSSIGLPAVEPGDDYRFADERNGT